jgi:aminoglycoside phosphotransferase (APT) family kinase protein
VQTAEGPFVIRLHEPFTLDLGVDRLREALLHRIAADAGIASRILAADPQGRYLVTEFVEGTAWRAVDLEDEAHLRNLAQVLAQLHSLPAPQVLPLDLRALLDRHVVQLGAQEPGLATLWSPEIDRAREILLRQAAAGRPACIVHGDLSHSNLIGAGRPHLIDWEYATVGDPLADLACLAAYYPAVLNHGPLLLEECGLASSATVEALAELAHVYRVLSNLWYRRLALAGRHPPPAN